MPKYRVIRTTIESVLIEERNESEALSEAAGFLDRGYGCGDGEMKLEGERVAWQVEEVEE